MQMPRPRGAFAVPHARGIEVISLLLIILMAMASSAIQSTDTKNVGWNGTTESQAVSGCAAYYAPNLMERAAVYWGHIDSTDEYEDWLHDSGYKGAIALYRVGDRLREIHILWPDGTLDGPYIAIESVASRHYDIGMAKNMVVDVDYSTARRYDMNGPMRVVILYEANSIFDYLVGGAGAIGLPGYSVGKYAGCMDNN